MAPPYPLSGLSEATTTAQATCQLGLSEAWIRRLVIVGRLRVTATPLGRWIPRAAVELLDGEPEHTARATRAAR